MPDDMRRRQDLDEYRRWNDRDERNGERGYGQNTPRYGQGSSGGSDYSRDYANRDQGRDQGRGSYRGSEYRGDHGRGSTEYRGDFGSYERGDYGRGDFGRSDQYRPDQSRGGDYYGGAHESDEFGRGPSYGPSHGAGYRDEQQGRGYGYGGASSSTGYQGYQGYGRGQQGRGQYEGGRQGGYRAERHYGGTGRPPYYGSDFEREGQRGEDRGFWDRASDEVASWFGDDDAERRRHLDSLREGQHRGRGPRGYRRSDERIREDISDRLTDDDYLDASEVDVSVSNGEVTLSGTVESRLAKRRAEDLAERISGVGHVQNNLRVRQQEQGANWGSGRTGGTTGSTTGSTAGSTAAGTQGTTTGSPANRGTAGTAGTSGTAGKTRSV